MNPRFKFGGVSRDRGSWLALGLLLLAVLAPTACLVYFMNEAIAKQRELASREVTVYELLKHEKVLLSQAAAAKLSEALSL